LILSFQEDLFDKISDSNLNLTMENHEYGLPPGFYSRFPVLPQWYNILTTTVDRNGTEYVSSMEGKKMPFFGKWSARIGHAGSLSFRNS